MADEEQRRHGTLTSKAVWSGAGEAPMPETEHQDCLWRNARLMTLAPERGRLGIIEPGAIASRDHRDHRSGVTVLILQIETEGHRPRRQLAGRKILHGCSVQ